MSDVNARRRDVAKYVAEETWDITAYRLLIPSSDGETSWAFAGRVAPAGIPRSQMGALPQEQPATHNQWIVVTEYSVDPAIKEGDRLHCVLETSEATITHNFVVVSLGQYLYKQEAMCEEQK